MQMSIDTQGIVTDLCGKTDVSRINGHGNAALLQCLRNDSILQQYLEGHDFEGALVGGFKDHRAGGAGALHLEPARSADAPAVSGAETGEAKMRHRRREVVAELRGHGEKLLRHNAADGVNTEVLRRGVATTVAEKSRNGIGAAGFERLAEDVLLLGFLLAI